jgi:hypothetical protein
MKPMHTTLYAAIACASSLLFIAPAGAQNKMSSQLDKLNGFVGDGTCTAKIMAMGKSPEKVASGKLHGEKTLGDRWIVVRFDETATATSPKPYHVAQYFTYDAKASHFVDVLFDNSGASYGAGTSDGWQGASITFENTDFTNGSHALSRDVFTRHGAHVVSHAGYLRDKQGKWIKTDEETCNMR